MRIWKISQIGWFGAVLLCLAAMLSCTGANDRVWIQGTYVHSGSGEFSVADDTLVVEHLGGRHYVVHRRTGFNLIADGKLGERQYEREEWRAMVEEGDGTVLLEQRWGKRLSFDVKRSTLEVGRRLYVKLD